MTDQYLQTNINRQRPGRFIDQTNADTNSPISGAPAVTLNNDYTFILAGAVPPPVAAAAYAVILPDVQTVEAFFFFVRNASGFPLEVVAQTGQVINGAPFVTVLPTEVLIIVSDPVNKNTTPATLPIGWTLIKNSAA